MGLKSYIIASILLMILVFGFTYTLELGDYTINLFGLTYTLPVALWFVLPLFFLSLLTYLHIIFYGILSFFKTRSLECDQANVLKFIKTKLLEKENKVSFKTKSFKELADILAQLNINVKENNFISNDQELNELVSKLQDINKGVYVNEKYIKLQESSSLAKKNLINKINSQVYFAVDIVKKAEKYDYDIVKIAFMKVIEEKSMTSIKKLYKNIKLDRELALKLLNKNIENEEFGFENDEILELIKSVNLNKIDYIKLAITYKQKLNPDRLIELFENISAFDEEAMFAYLYILSEFEMNDKLREKLSNSNKEEYTPFKALVDLRDAGKHYDLEEISYK